MGECVKERYVFLYLFHAELAYQLVILADGDTQDLGDSFYGRSSGNYGWWERGGVRVEVSKEILISVEDNVFTSEDAL